MDASAVFAPPPKPGWLERARSQFFYSPAASLVTFAIAALLLWALWQSQQGENTELNRAQLSEMLGVAEPLEPVA